MNQALSNRANQSVPGLDIPWRFAPRGTYHPDANPDGLISFATAENTLLETGLETFLRDVTIPKDALAYRYSTGGGPVFPTSLASHLNEYFHPYRPLTGTDIQVTGSATAMHEIIGWAVADRGEGVLTSKPVYGRFELDFGNKVGLKMIYAETTVYDSFDIQVIEKFEAALRRSEAAGVKIRALLIVNPNNPLGRCYPRETLVALMKFCCKHRIHLVSDEVYASSVHTPDHADLPPFTSVLSINPDGLMHADYIHVTYGLSKDFAVPGLRVGAIISQSTALHRAVKTVMRFHNPSGASIAIVDAMLTERSWCRSFLQTSQEKIREAYKHVTTALESLGIQYLPANAGFFIYVNLSPFLTNDGGNPEFRLAQKMLNEGVFLHPGEERGPVGWFRLVYTQDPRIITEGLDRIRKVLF